MQPAVEHIQPSRDQSFRMRRDRRKAFPFAWHHHPEAELTLIIQGQGLRYVGDRITEYHEGDLVLLGPGVPHTWSSEARRHGRVESLYAQFLPRCLGDGFLDSPELRRVKRLLDQAELGLTFSANASAWAAQAMIDMVDQSPLARMLRLWEVLDRLAVSRGRQTIASTPYRQGLRPRDRGRLDRVCRAVEADLAAPWSLADAAALVHLHPASFARFFKRMMGQSFVAYLHRVRIGHAGRLLIETDLSVTEIALRSGFGNLAQFHRVFKRVHEQTPRQYRLGFRED